MNINRKFYLILALLLVYAGVVWYKAIVTLEVDGEAYRKRVAGLQSEVKPIEPVRGFIFARNGELLAGSLPEYDLMLDFRSTTKKNKRGQMNIPRETIVKYFSPDSVGTLALYNLYSDPNHPRKSKETISREILDAHSKRVARFPITDTPLPYLDYLNLLKQPYFNKGSNLSGLLVEERGARFRPYGERRMGAAVIGGVYVKQGKDSTQMKGHGQRGLELGFDSYLAGIPGKGFTRKVRRRSTMIPIESVVEGANVHTTLDVEMMQILDQALEKRLLELNAMAGWGAFMEVKTGKIVAISNLSRKEGGYCVEDYNHLTEDLIAPGSTFKTASYMILLENGKITPEKMVDTENYDNDHPHPWVYNGKPIRDDHAVGRQCADELIVQSSNIGVAKMTIEAYGSHPEEYFAALNRLGFLDDHALTDEELEQLKSQQVLPAPYFKHEFPGLRPARHRFVKDGDWSNVSLAQISYGYETQIPGIYMLQFYNGIANGGKLIRPYIVDYVERNGEVLWEQEETVLNERMCSETTLKAVQHALEGVVDHGTAAGKWNKVNGAFGPNGEQSTLGVKSQKVKIAGKTGTAQRYNETTKGWTGAGHYVSFAGYFPAEDPQYCGIIVINTYGTGILAAGGGYMVGPVFKSFAEQVYARNCLKDLDDLPVDTLSLLPQVKAGPWAKASSVLDEMKLTGNVDVKDVSTTNVVPGLLPEGLKGMGASDALQALENAGFKNVKIIGYGSVANVERQGNTVILRLK